MEEHDDPEPTDPEQVVLEPAARTKLAREIRSVRRQLEAASIEQPAALCDFDVSAELTLAAARKLRREIQSARHQLRPPADGNGKPKEESEPSGDPGEIEEEAPPRLPPGFDEKAELRRVLKTLRTDAALSRLVAIARPFEPERVLEALDGLVSIDDDGGLFLHDPEDVSRTIPLDAATLRRLLPDDLPPPPGAGPGSCGTSPRPAGPAGNSPDLIEKAARSQTFFERHRAEVEAELRRRQRGGPGL